MIRDIDSFSFDPSLYPFKISLLQSPISGQVNQRIFGFLNLSHHLSYKLMQTAPLTAVFCLTILLSSHGWSPFVILPLLCRLHS